MASESFELRTIRLFSRLGPRCDSSRQDRDVDLVPLSSQARRCGATAQHFVVWMRRNYQYLHFSLPSSGTFKILTSATMRPSYKAERLNSKRNPACSRK